MKVTELKPQALWTIFDEITQVPRPSKKRGEDTPVPKRLGS